MTLYEDDGYILRQPNTTDGKFFRSNKKKDKKKI